MRGHAPSQATQPKGSSLLPYTEKEGVRPQFAERRADAGDPGFSALFKRGKLPFLVQE